GDDLDEALALAQRERAYRSGKRETADADVDALVLGLFLAQPDVRDLGFRVHAVGRRVIVGHAIGVAGDVLYRANAFVRRDVREHDAADHVADRPHVVGGRAQVRVDHDAPAL